jgi:tetratricopeptide (TPR) repeat protein
MTSNAFSWLHLTDLHFGLHGQNPLWPNLRAPFLDDLAALHEQTGPWQAVFFTGDLVQKGKSTEYQAMQQEVLTRLWDKLRELGSGDALLLAVPGNHDLFRPNPDDDNGSAVEALLDIERFERIKSKFWDKPGCDYRTVVNNAFGAYTAWWQNVAQRPQPPAHKLTQGILPGDFACTLDAGGQKIGIVGLNTAFLQLGAGDYHGKLEWDARQLHAVCGGAVDDWQARHALCLLLTHQGPDWLSKTAQKHGANEIAPAGRFALHLFGHMHETGLQSIRIGGNPLATRLFQATSVFGMEHYGEPPREQRSHGYCVGRIEFKAGHASLRLWPRIASNNTGPWRFVADVQNAHLENDGGTQPENLPVRGLTVKAHASADAVADAGTVGHVHAPVRSRMPHSTLPRQTAFFGRTEELAFVERYLQPAFKGWGVVLDGPGGIGKTALAIEAAHRAPAELYPLKLFVSAKQTRLDPDGPHPVGEHRVNNYFELLTELGMALGREEVQRTPDESLPDLIRHALAPQRALLVLDNLEALTREDRRSIYNLLETLPAQCRAIVTSRRRDETAARTLRLDKLDFAATCQLLAELAERAGSEGKTIAALSEKEQASLYAETGGNPLLLTWVAAQMIRNRGRCRTLSEAVQRLKTAHEREQEDANNDPLAFIFGDLLDTFSANETALLSALALFTEPAPLAWLLPIANLSPKAAETALDDLRDRALLLEDNVQGTWLLPPLCTLFLKRHRPQAVALAGQRLEIEATALALQHGGDSEDKAPFHALEAAWPQIEAALPLLLAGDNARLQKVCSSLTEFLDFSGRWNAKLQLSQKAEAKALAAGDFTKAGWRAYQAGWVHHLQGHGNGVLAASERCASHWQQAGGAVREQAIALQLRGDGHHQLKDYAAACSALTQALTLNRTLGAESIGVANALNSLAISQEASGDLAAAKTSYNEALRISQKINYREGIANYSGNLADLALQQQDWPTAEKLAAQALQLAENIGRQELIAYNHRTLAETMLAQQQPATALPHAQQAVAIFARLTSPGLADAQATLTKCQQALTKAEKQ